MLVGLFASTRTATGVIVANYTDCIISNLAGASSTVGRGRYLKTVVILLLTIQPRQLLFNMTNCVFKNMESYGFW